MTDAGHPWGTPEYRAFRRAFREYDRDGPDVTTLDALTPEERRAAEQELLGRLADRDDHRYAIAGLTHLRSPAAVAPLRAIMRSGHDRRAVAAAIALWRLGEDADEAFRTLCDAVERRPRLGDGGARADAAYVLSTIDRPAALATLVEALDDRDRMVRTHAWVAVRERLWLGAEAEANSRGQLSDAQFQAVARATLARFGGKPDPAAERPRSKVVTVRRDTSPATAVRSALPLEIREVHHDDPVLRLAGEGWRLDLRCAWRVIGPGREYTSESATVADDVRGLHGRRIVAVSFADDITVDPVFDLGDGVALSVHADTAVTPWFMLVPPGLDVTGRRGSAPASATGPYRRFRHDVLDHPPRQGPDLRLLDELAAADRPRAEQELLARVGESTDAIRALAHLRSAAAVGPLRAVLRSGSTDRVVRAAAALWEIAEDEEAFRVLCDLVRHRPLLRRVVPGRAEATRELGRIARPGALVVLIGALDDRDPWVSRHARTAVAQRLGLDLELDAWRAGYLTLAEFRDAARAALAAGEDPA